MKLSQEFRPDWASPPGDTIRDILRERHISEVEFARLMRITSERASELLEGRASVTIGIARRLESLFGASVEYWMSRDFQFREDLARFRSGEEQWLAELPLGDMKRYGWLKPAPHPANEVASCLRFFDVPTIGAWREKYANLHQMMAFRTSPSLDSKPGAVAAWLRQGEIIAESIECGSWDAKRFEQSLPSMVPLTRVKDPRRFVPELQNRCAASGVAVVIVRAPSGCRASGATRFLSPNKALLLLSFRYLTDDHFWFTFFHEAGHLLLHGDKVFLEGLDVPTNAEESEANQFAEDILVPPPVRPELLKLGPNTREVIRFARHIGVSPGVIVGQLQHRGRIKHNQLNGLKRRFRWQD